MSKSKRIAVLLLALMLVLTLFTGCQQDPAETPDEETGDEAWVPERPITMVVGFGAGGGVDTMARVLAEVMGEELGVEVVVQNMPGAGSGSAAEYVMGQEADGYTILAVSSAAATYAAMDNSNATYNELDMMGIMVLSEPAFQVPESSDIETMEDLIALWKSGEETTAANAGNGGLWHIPQLIALNRAGADIEKVSFVPYASGKEDATAIAKGEVDWGVSGAFLESAEFFKEGLSKPLCIFSDQGYEIPEYGMLEPITKYIPEITEEDILIGAGWRGITIKKGTPENVYATLESALKAAYESEEFTKLMSDNGLIPAGYFGEEANELYASTSQMQSWLLYDLGYANRSPEEVNVPRLQ